MENKWQEKMIEGWRRKANGWGKTAPHAGLHSHQKRVGAMTAYVFVSAELH